jgi:hypothetical protein
VDTLNSASNITVFAPDNAAFAKIPAATLKKLLANKAGRVRETRGHGPFGLIRGRTGPLAQGLAQVGKGFGYSPLTA